MSTRNVLIILVLAGALAACSAKKKPGEPQADSDPPAATAAAAVDAGASAAQVGARIYRGNCVPCHQQTGAGIAGVYPCFAGSPPVLGDPAQLALWVIKGQRPSSMP